MSEDEYTLEDPSGEYTLEALADAADLFARAARWAKAHGLKVGRFVGAGSHAIVFELESPLGRVLKLPYVTPREEHPDRVPVGQGPMRIVESTSPTGPMSLCAPVSIQQAAGLLRKAWERQRALGVGHPLAELFEVVEVAGGMPAAIIEQVYGTTLERLLSSALHDARAALPSIARALATLHESFGPHGDLKPAHVFVNRGDVVFIDPLVDGAWMGSIGYALPLFRELWGKNTPPVDELARLRDLFALAVMVAEAHAVDLRVLGRVAYLLANRGNGRFDRGFELTDFARKWDERASQLPEPMRDWVREVVQVTLGTLEIKPSHERPEPGFSATMLARLGAVAPKLRLRLVHCAPGVEVSGLDVDGCIGFDGDVSVGRGAGNTLVVKGALIGGQRNCLFVRLSDGSAEIQHTGHMIDVFHNGRALPIAGSAKLEVGDTVKPIDAANGVFALTLVVEGA